MSDVFAQVTYNAVAGGQAVRVTKYPLNAVGSTLTASGKTTGAYKFAAAGANVVAIVAKNTIGANWLYAWFSLDNPSAGSIFVVRL